MLRSESIGWWLVSVVVLVSSAGCDFLAEDSVNVTIETDRAAYSAAPGSAIRLTVTNVAEAPLHFVCEGWVDLEEFRRGRRVKSWKMHRQSRENGCSLTNSNFPPSRDIPRSSTTKCPRLIRTML